jgi:CHAT domain-containing protein/tetratricopeptide (TPR) repeat protein
LDESVDLHLRALEIRQEVLGPDHPEVAMSLSNLGASYLGLGRYEDAQDALRRALAIDRTVLGPEHPAVAADIENLGELAMRRGDYVEADSLYSQALSINLAATGRGSVQAARSLNYLGRLRIKQRRLVEADSLLNGSLDISRTVFGDGHHLTATNLEDLSVVSRLRNENPEAVNLARQALEARNRAFVSNSSVLSESDALMYSELLRASFEGYLSCYWSLDDEEKRTTDGPVDMILACKGGVSDGLFRRLKAVVETADSATASLAEDLRFARFQLAQMFVEGPGEDLDAYESQLAELQAEVTDLESELAMLSADYRSEQHALNLTAGAVKSVLPDSCCLIEYVRYSHSEPVEDKLEDRYIAVVLAAGGEPVVEELGRAAGIDSTVDVYRRHMLRIAGQRSNPTPVDMAEYGEISLALWNLVWAPLEDHIAGNTMAIIAPDGALNLVSFAGLSGQDGTYLNDRLVIHYLSSARDLLRLAEARDVAGNELLVLGAPDYDAVPYMEPELALARAEREDQKPTSFTRGMLSDCRELGEMTVEDLPGARREVEMIEAAWDTAGRGPARVYTGAAATEERLKSEARGKEVIHLATHGYYLGDRCSHRAMPVQRESSSLRAGDNPLLLSGVFLAGANSRRVEDLGLRGEDGILTAYEVSSLDLRGTRLVVLSACETALGEVREGEGVYGLRRAFQMAGAGTVISALWPISDESTAGLAGLLYQGGDESIAVGIQQAQALTARDLRSRGKSDHPFLWAGFIAVGAWE